MKNIIILLYTILTVIMVSCNASYQEIGTYEVQHAFILNSSPNFKGYYYQGTDHAYHYFVSKWDVQKDKLFKLKKDDLIIEEPKPFKAEEIRIVLFETDKKFGDNEFYILYVDE